MLRQITNKEKMIQLKRPQRHVETPTTPPTIQTMEQLLRGNPLLSCFLIGKA